MSIKEIKMAEMGFIEALNSINVDKKNIIRQSNNPKLAEKLYTPFPVARSLSYSPDCIMFVNEINTRGLYQFGVSHLMHYEFLLNLIIPKKRYAKWSKPETNATINHIMEMECLSYDKARDIYNLLTDDVKKEIDRVYATKDANAKPK